MGRQDLRCWIEQRQGRGLDARRLRFWEAILGVPHRTVTEWIARMDPSWAHRSGEVGAEVQSGAFERHAASQLVESWMEDDQEEQARTLELLRGNVDIDRLSDRRRFSE